MSTSRVWLVTGSARGLGRNITEAVLAAGDRLIATARDPQRLADLVERYGDRIRPVSLDVTDAAAAQAAVQTAIDAFGRIDVLVNNAGFGQISPFEQTREDEFRAQIDANFYGVVNVTRAVLPVMRRQRSGHIFQISSIGGRIGTPGLSAYQAAKWAVGGFSEVLKQELGPLGIKVTILEPGGMKTEWGTSAGANIPDILPEYKPTFDVMFDLLAQHIGHETSDPARVADLIVRLAGHDTPLHLLIGSDALHFASIFDTQRDAAEKIWREVSASTDFAASATPPALPETAPAASMFSR